MPYEYQKYSPIVTNPISGFDAEGNESGLNGMKTVLFSLKKIGPLFVSIVPCLPLSIFPKGQP